MTVALREPSSKPVAENTVDTVTEQTIPSGPVHCGSHMAISAGPSYDSMQWVAVEPIWPEWACGCGFRMDIDALDPVSGVWIAALRRQSLQHELAIAQNTLELAFKKAVDAGVDPRALAEVTGVPVTEVDLLLK
ncbi:hypothetical protein HAV21_12035 [Paenarthrobacter sp. MSM-2-10-13]|nr:hypothetical protein [Paenarthrobacter sp. MSM-2-10-13]NHW47613.1 hypothetical protein [Paenarthrobacter sp. MSM-2-10-13]TQS93452.1 hypothetical protein EU811_05445 [Arthrobacter sp. TS-15]BCW65030.1 hypothetical protein StoSoilB22_40030 [Arthrobacter sp. StoSoilB22]